MSGKRLEDLLQQCLDGYDGGMTPDECLSAFPGHRAELEPLLRQALSLRITFASAPSERFVAKARESLMFHAGRDVSAALAAEPDEDFKMDARQRLIMAGGAAVQEALRDVPPPRLPFWVTARGRILDAARNRPAPQPKPVLVARPALSMSLAGFVAAIAIASVAFFGLPNSQPSAAAELAAIERQLATIEQQKAQGVKVSPDLLAELTRRTNELAERLRTDDSQTVVTLSLQPLITRQWELLNSMNLIKPPVGEPNSAREQITAAQNQLLAAEEKVQVLTSRTIAPPAAAQANNPAPPAQAQQPSASNQPPSPPASSPLQSQAQPQPTAPAFQPSQSQAQLGPVPAGQVRVRGLSNDTTGNMNWVEIRTSELRFVAPAGWNIVGILQNANGIATLGGPTIGFAGPDGNAVIFNTRTLNFDAVIGGQAFPGVQRIDAGELANRAGSWAIVLRHMVDSLEATSR